MLLKSCVCVYFTVSSKQKNFFYVIVLKRAGHAVTSYYTRHAWLVNFSLPCTNSRLRDSERINLEHISHGLLDGKIFPHWEDPTAFTLEE